MNRLVVSLRGSALVLLMVAAAPFAAREAAAAMATPQARYQAATASGWSLQNVPPPTVPGGSLTAISCSGPLSCMAVGSYTDRTGAQAALAEAWNGRTWSIVPAVSPSGSAATALTAVSCPSAGFCVAVGTWSNSAGQSHPLAERWQGGRWSTLAIVNPVTSQRTVLSGVACTSTTACIAVGYFSNPAYTVTLAERWDGHHWAVQRTANVLNPTSPVWGVLNGIWCLSATSCTAVGYYDTSVVQRTLAELWNGMTWSIQPTPNLPGKPANGLNAVTCRAANQCMAGGNYLTGNGSGGPLAEAWNGRTWTITPTPAPAGARYSYLYGVACPSAGVCLAVGYSATGNTSRTLAEQWNGRTWSIKSASPPAGSAQSQLTGIWCRSARVCTAVGSTTGAVSARTLAQTWTGSAWSITPTPNPAVPLVSGLYGVSCPTLNNCVAVGFYTNTSVTGPLTELWNGKAWSIVPAPIPPGREVAILTSVSCVAAGNCVAVGSSYNGTDNFTLAEQWNGTHWSVMPTSNVTGAQSTVLSAVSCAAAGHCAAVGYYATAAYTRPLAQIWNGHAWTTSATPNPAGSQYTSMSGVSCPAANRCVAVGSYATASANMAMAEAWNGTTWSIQSIPSPAGATGTYLQALSCPSAAACMAVGNYYNGSTTVPLAEAWNGAKWSAQSPPAIAGAFYGTLFAVSCQATGDCVAAGYGTRNTITGTLAQAWNGHNWSIAPTPNPSGAQQSYLYGLSCPRSGSCAAVGDYSKSPVSTPVPLAARFQ